MFSMNSDSWLRDFIQPSDTQINPSDCWNTEALLDIPWDTTEPGNLPTLDDIPESILPSTEAFNFRADTSFPKDAEQQPQKLAEIEKRVKELEGKLSEQWRESQGTEIILEQTNQLHVLVDQLPGTVSSYPCLQIFIGSEKKTRVLKELVPSVKKGCISRKKKKRPIQLLLDPGTIFHDRQLLYADCPTPDQLSSSTVCDGKGCPDVVSRVVKHDISDHVHRVAETVYSRLLGIFSDVVCLFYEDFNGIDAISDFLLSWMETGQQVGGLVRTYPSLILVLESESSRACFETDMRAKLLNSLAGKTELSIFDYFINVDVVSIVRPGKVSSVARLRRLKDRLSAVTKEATVRRKNARLLFKGTQFSVLFDYAFDQFIVSPHKSFDFIAASRIRNPVSSTWERHLLQFLRHFSSTEDLIGIAVPIISSALLQDAYPQDMHVFHPTDVFATLYREIILRVGKQWLQEQSVHSSELISMSLGKLIGTQFALSFHENMDASADTSAAAHRRLLETFQPCLGKISTLCSMMCLQRPPEHKLPCGHTALEDRIGLPLPVQQNFDMFLAPSSGAFNIMALALRGILIHDAIETFGNLAKEAFLPRRIPLSRLPFLLAMTIPVRIIVWLFTGVKYPSKGIERVVKSVFTQDLTMSDCSYATEIGAKIAVLVTDVVGCRPFLFTNYHGKQQRKSECGYQVVEIQGDKNDPQAWEIALGTSAAPWYYKPRKIASRVFQDGGLWMNDPTALVDSEIKVIASEEEQPLVVSLGTGSVDSDGQYSPSSRRGFWKNGLIYRLYEAFMSSIGSKRYWRSDHNYYRFNVKFDGKEPELDDTRQIPAMANRADEQFRGSRQLDELALRLIAAHFHFELDDVPSRFGNRFTGVGYILCDLKKGHPAYDALTNHLVGSGAKFYMNECPLAAEIGDRHFRDSTGNVHQRVDFTTTQETLSFQLKIGQSKPQEISGSPFSLVKRARDQNLDCFFGQANHRKRKHSAHTGGEKSKKRQKTHQ
ncbi:hypothetical protein ZTR_09248 [Talaromyces verruculosus]|nr:hypothetical protein ZTR_09248 [Talaromyces verruculosus]